jgi:hypothetical protein
MPKCQTCFDVGWVCENHPDRPWSKTKPGGCECGAGEPCPTCNGADTPDEPRLPAGFKTDLDKDGSRH